MIGDGIVITVVDISCKFGKEVRIGIEAPAETTVDREEIRIRKARDGEAKIGVDARMKW